jgi:hypothetical protein
MRCLFAEDLGRSEIIVASRHSLISNYFLRKRAPATTKKDRRISAPVSLGRATAEARDAMDRLFRGLVENRRIVPMAADPSSRRAVAARLLADGWVSPTYRMPFAYLADARRLARALTQF